MSTTSSVSPNSFSEFPIRRFTVDEYRRLAETGILTEDDRVELLEGYIVPKMIHNPPHDASVKLVDEAIRARLSSDWHTRIQSAITTDDSEPEPDVAVVRGAIRDYSSRHPRPSDIGLLVEVAESSLDRDRRKCQVYARAGIEHYWIVNLQDRHVEVFALPGDESPVPAYRRRQVFSAAEKAPLILSGQQYGEVAVIDLLP